MSKSKSRSKSQEKALKSSSIPVSSTSSKSSSSSKAKPSESKSSSKRSSSSEKKPKSEKSDSKKKEDKVSKSKSKLPDSSANKENRKHRKHSEKPKTPEPEPELQYEDDFEDYSDDFESDEEKEAATPNETTVPSVEVDTKNERIDSAHSSIQNGSPKTQPQSNEVAPTSPKDEQADTMPEETPLLRRLASRQGPRPNREPVKEEKPVEKEVKLRVSSADRNINFSSAVSTNFESASQSEKRFRKLRELISLESVRYSVIDLPPVKDYDFYMELFGVAGKTQAYCQTGDDNVTEETQTEVGDTDTKWTQQPATDEVTCGSATTATTSDSAEEEDMNIFRQNHMQNERLKQFVRVAGQVIIDLITSRHVTSSHLHVKNKSEFSFSAGYHALSLQPTAHKSRVTCISRAHHDARHVLVSSFILESPAEDLVSRSLLAEMYMDNSQPPKRLFVSEGEVQSTVYAPDDSALFAGLKDGSVVVFDLLEAEYNFADKLPWLDSPSDLPLRVPAFDTSYISSTLNASSKLAPIVQVQICSKKEDATLQLAALSECGTLWIYSVTREDTRVEGMRPGAQLSLNVAAIVKPDPVVVNSSSQPTPLIANCMVTKRSSQQFFVGTDSGFLCSMSRTKSSSFTGPRLYKSKMQVFGEVTCIQISLFDENILLSGLSSGCLSIFRTEQSAPTVVLTPPNSSRKIVTAVQWSPVFPSIFYSIHGGTRLLVWDLSMGKSPLAVTDLSTQISSPVVCTNCWLEPSENGGSAKGIAYMGLGLQDGTVEVHVLEPFKPRTDEPIATVLRKIENGT